MFIWVGKKNVNKTASLSKRFIHSLLFDLILDIVYDFAVWRLSFRRRIQSNFGKYRLPYCMRLWLSKVYKRVDVYHNYSSCSARVITPCQHPYATRSQLTSFDDSWNKIDLPSKSTNNLSIYNFWQTKCIIFVLSWPNVLK